MAESLGAALGRSLGCALSDVAGGPSGSQWVFRAGCPGVFQRRGQVLEGQLKFGAFRQALTKTSTEEIEIDVGVPDAPYSRGAFPRAWDRICRNGVVHRTGSVEPRQLPTRAIHVAVGYRNSDLVLIFGPLPYSLLLTLLLLIRLNGSARKARRMDPRALWFAYRRGIAWSMTGVFLLGAALWAAISGALGGDTDLWALYSVWHGGSALRGRMLAASFYVGPALLMAVLSVWWTPRVFAMLRDPGHRFLDTMKMFLLPALGWIVPAYWTIAAFGALGREDFAQAFVRFCVAVTVGLFCRFAIRRGRAERAPLLDSGEVYDRLQALAARCGVALREIRVAPISAAVMPDPVEVEGGRVALSELVMETLEPAEIEAEVARCWSLPLRKHAVIRQVLLFFLALCIGMGLSLAIVFGLGILQLALHLHAAEVLARLSLPMAIVLALIVARWIQGLFVRRAERRAAVLVGSPEVVKSAAGKVAAMQLAPWKWDRASGTPVAGTVPDFPCATASLPGSSVPAAN